MTKRATTLFHTDHAPYANFSPWVKGKSLELSAQTQWKICILIELIPHRNIHPGPWSSSGRLAYRVSRKSILKPKVGNFGRIDENDVNIMWAIKISKGELI